MCKCRSHGTFPLFGLQSSHLNICYYHQDLHRRPLRPGSRPRFCGDRRALLLIGAWRLPRRPGVSAQLGTVTRLPVHPASPVLLTKNGPLGALDSSFAPIPKSDERFARQYRCGPPPEFPLASPRSGIVHHLSGPDRHARTRTLLRRSRSVGGATPRGIPPVSFLTPYGFDRPLTRTHTPWSVFQDGPNGELAGRRRERAVAEARLDGARCPPRSRRRRLLGRINSPGFGRRRNPRRSTPRADRRTGFLGQNLPPDWGCIPKQPDSPTAPRGATGSGHNGALTLSGATFQWTWARSAAEDASPDYNSNADGARFSSWAVPGSLAVTRGILLRRSGASSVAGRSERDESAQLATEVRRPPIVVAFVAEDPAFVPTARGDAREAIVRPSRRSRGMRGGGNDVTRRCSFVRPGAGSRDEGDAGPEGPPTPDVETGSRVVLPCRFDNDPSAGSPTETLLRLLLPLNDKVQWTSRDVAGSEPPASPRSEHFTGPFNR
ncbi:unnamed protein product [Malus baccata var. baccata]